MIERGLGTTPGIRVFAVFVFFLTAIPRANVRIGPIPIYLIDLLIVILVLYALQARPFPGKTRPFQGIIIVLLVFAVLGEVAGSLESGAILDATYTIGRTCLAFCVFYVTGQMVRGPKDLELVLKAAVLGLIVTALMMVLTSLPFTRAFVADIVLTKSFLEPAAESASEKFLAAGESGVRGRTLVGVSIVGASFINGIWPLGALLLRWPGRLGYWRTIALCACLLAPMGVLMSYSRGPIIGSILMLLLVLVLGVRRIRRGIILPLLAGAVVVFVVGVGSQVFFFDRLTDRAVAMYESPLEDERESERVLAYSEPFQHLLANPRFLLIGEGNSIRRSDVQSEQAGHATHALFAQAYYSNGMIAAVLYMYLIIGAVMLAFRHFRRSRSTIGAHLSQAILLAMVSLVPLAAFDHAIVSTPRVAMFFFFILGLLSSLKHFQLRPMPTISRDAGYGYGRNVAV